MTYIHNPSCRFMNEEAEKMAESEYGRSRSMDKRLEAQGKSKAESKVQVVPATPTAIAAVIQQQHKAESRNAVCTHCDGTGVEPFGMDKRLAERLLANRDRRIRAEARLEQHYQDCDAHNHFSTRKPYQCGVCKQRERELAEAKHETHTD